MELRRSRRWLLGGIFFLLASVFVLLCGRTDGLFRLMVALIFGGFGLLTGAGLIVNGLKPFRFHIGADGLTLRLRRINRLLRWDEIEALVLDQPRPQLRTNRFPRPQLLLIPANEQDLGIPLTNRSPIDDRACLVLLELDDVKDAPEQVAEALARFGGSRFTDIRKLRAARFSSPDFTVVLRGYDTDRVDELVRRGQDALVSGGTLQRFGAKGDIENARARLPIALRGYDRGQVDSFLDALSEELASWQADGEPG